jgi:DNA-directed RNA polymerase subunit E'/Rpb7
MESDALFQEKVYLTPKDLSGEITSIDAILLEKVKERLEQRCSPHGYVLSGSLELLTRSAGMVDSGRFSGDWAFLVKARGRVLHPPEGSVVDVEILKSNKMGIYAVYENAIRLMVPRDLHIGDVEFEELKVGERIRVEIQKSRFQLRDPFIVSVGLYRGRSGAPMAPAAPLAKTIQPITSVIPEEEAEELEDAEDAEAELVEGEELNESEAEDDGAESKGKEDEDEE